MTARTHFIAFAAVTLSLLSAPAAFAQSAPTAADVAASCQSSAAECRTVMARLPARSPLFQTAITTAAASLPAADLVDVIESAADTGAGQANINAAAADPAVQAAAAQEPSVTVATSTAADRAEDAANSKATVEGVEVINGVVTVTNTAGARAAEFQGQAGVVDQGISNPDAVLDALASITDAGVLSGLTESGGVTADVNEDGSVTVSTSDGSVTGVTVEVSGSPA